MSLMFRLEYRDGVTNPRDFFLLFNPCVLYIIVNIFEYFLKITELIII